MKNLTYSEFTESIQIMAQTFNGVVTDGDIVRVESHKKGAFIIMNEREYEIMHKALKIVFSLSGAANEDGVIDCKDILEKTKSFE